ncbi:unnamed protein product [Timema podura]|uniref:Uncharacterized protein n=1 Tax=Timema podura TaxID=61482 RepID=A0ABN7PC94_TIMPD|nr:unnamed protein product [Timema podura]
MEQIDDLSIVHHNAIARAASRVALYLMREDMKGDKMIDENQHAHDFFVVNSCKIFCDILEPPSKPGFVEIISEKVDKKKNLKGSKENDTSKESSPCPPVTCIPYSREDTSISKLLLTGEHSNSATFRLAHSCSEYTVPSISFLSALTWETFNTMPR